VSDAAIEVTIGADASQYLAQSELVRAQMAKLQTQMRETANAMTQAGDVGAQHLRARLNELASAAIPLKAHLEELQRAMNPSGGSGHSGGVGGLNNMQMLESVHVVKAFVDEVVAGQNPLRALAMEGGRIGQIISMGIPPAIVAYAGLPSGAVAVAAALAYVGYSAYEANQAIANIRLDAASNHFQISSEQAAKARDTIKGLAQVGDADAEKIAKPFTQLGPVGAMVAELLAPSMKQLAKAMDADLAKAAERVSQRFTDLDGAGRQFVETSRGMTQAEKEHFSQ
jgi:hypothetical protein